LDRDFLLENYRRLVRRLYEPGNYYRRIRTFLASHRMQGPPACHSWRDVGAVFKSFWLMGIVHGGRRAYWSLLATTVVRYPRQIGVVMTLAITGYHHRRTAAELLGE